MERDLLSDPLLDGRPSDDGAETRTACRGGAERLEPTPQQTPFHVALIMDGNGRWAKARGLPRLAGHRQGVEALREVVKAAPDLGITVLTLYAFSTENWRRPADEVSGLMDLLRRYLMREADELMRQRVRILFIGDRAALDRDISERMDFLERLTIANDRMTVVMAINYGARAELTAAVRQLADAVASGRLAPEAVCEDQLSRALQTSDLPDPDLVLRTSGEQRLSNFLLWQAAYAELMFVPEPWPEFTPEAFARAVNGYRRRERRFGGVEAREAPGAKWETA